MSFVNFARTGNPNIAGLPGWAACTGEHLTTMIFDRQCEARTDCEEEMLEFAMKAAPPVRIDPSMFPVDEDALEENADGRAWVF